MISQIYLDYAASTPLDPLVIAAMVEFLQSDNNFGNAASLHSYGQRAKAIIETAREEVAALINCSPQEIYWTSGATEANNLAIKGVADFYKDRGKHIITMSTEHKSVLQACRQLQAQGFMVTYLDPEIDGLLDINKLQASIRPDTILVSIMQVNNETGIMQDIAKIGDLLKSRGIPFHVDAVQSAGKIPIDLSTLPVDLMSFSGHKVYGPKGIGFLYRRNLPRTQLNPQIVGGSQERGLRSGTLATQQILGIGKAFLVAKQRLQQDREQALFFKKNLWDGIKDLPGVRLNGCYQQAVPNILNVSFCGVNTEALLMAIRGLAVSTGSACNATNLEPSYVLRALQVPGPIADSSIRFSFGRFTTSAEIDFAKTLISEQFLRLREMAPAAVGKFYGSL